MLLKRMLTLVLMFSFSMPAFLQLAGADADLESSANKPPFTTLQITYKESPDMGGALPGMKIESQEIKYIDAVNNRTRTETTRTVTMNNFEQTDKEIQFSNGDKFYTLDPATKEATVVDIPHATTPVWVEINPVESMKVGEEEILGYTCQIYETVTMKVWAWHGIEMRTELHQEGMSSIKEAVDIQENIPLDPSLFELPEGVTPTSLGDLGKQIQEKLAALSRQE